MRTGKRSTVAESDSAQAGNRYERQLWMAHVGVSGQQKLSNASVLVVGAGGLGSPILLYLAAAGVGTIGIVDSDTVNLSNLNRQILYQTADIGQPKARVAKERLAALNPDVCVEEYSQQLDSSNATALFSAYSVVIDATDNYPTRYLLSDAAVLSDKPLFIGAVSGLHGLVLTVIPHRTPCFRCLYPRSPTAAMAHRERMRGILGTNPGIVGSIVAQNAVKYILGIGDWLAGRLLLIDGEDNRFEVVQVERDASCRACGDHPTITELVSLRTDPGQSSC